MATLTFGNSGLRSRKEPRRKGVPRVLHGVKYQRRRRSGGGSPLLKSLLEHFPGNPQCPPGFDRRIASLGANFARAHGANHPFRGLSPAGIKVLQTPLAGLG